ncbi:MAG: lipocalin-like domain-containing protein [Promethearchaeota archaeon]
MVGTWKLVSYEYHDTNGKIYYPFGKDTKLHGYLIYSAERYMSVTVMSSDRTNFAIAGPRGGTTEEKIAAFDSYLSYCGTYEIQQNTVIHHIEICFYPNWSGTDRKRIFSIEGDRLSITTLPRGGAGVELIVQYIWERVKDS